MDEENVHKNDLELKNANAETEDKQEQNVDKTNNEVSEHTHTTDVPVPEQIEERQKKSYRKRKKHYFNAIRTQMEFYFGDANLNKDRFLKQLINKDPYIPLDIFMTFNKIKALTSSVDDIAKSLSNSQLLELDETKQKVKRKIPLSEDRNVDEKTLYVEALPSTADHEWVRKIFERFGKVEYISLPRYTKSRKIKEFGFVEFEKEDSVNKAVKTFKEFNGVLSLQEQDPSDLISVKSYIKEKISEEGQEEVTNILADSSRKRNLNEGIKDEAESEEKKCKMESQDVSEKSNTENNSTTQSESESKAECEGDSLETNVQKKKRKRKKKSKTIEKLKRQAELNTDVAYYELKILPKKDWKKLRNKYLNLQREKIAEIKRKAWREQQELKQQKDTMVVDDNLAQSSCQEQLKKTKPSAKHKLQKMNMNFYGAAEEEAQSKTSVAERFQQNIASERSPLFSYEPGLIVEISFLEPLVNTKEFKADMRQYSSVKYIDIKEGSMQGYLRLESPQKALEFIQQITCAEYQCKILTDEAESNYWKKIEKDREQKLNKQVKVPQKRGREKVKKIINTHIRFGDDEE